MEDLTRASTWYSEELDLQYAITLLYNVLDIGYPYSIFYAFFTWKFCYEINLV